MEITLRGLVNYLESNPRILLTLAGVGVIAVSAAVSLAILITGIRQGDRRHLIDAPRSNSDALARRLLVGVRYPSDNPHGDHR